MVQSSCVHSQKCFGAFLLLTLCLHQQQPHSEFGQSPMGGSSCSSVQTTGMVLAPMSACKGLAWDGPWHKEPHWGAGGWELQRLRWCCPCRSRIIKKGNEEEVSAEELQLGRLDLGSIKCVPMGKALVALTCPHSKALLVAAAQHRQREVTRGAVGCHASTWLDVAWGPGSAPA